MRGSHIEWGALPQAYGFLSSIFGAFHDMPGEEDPDDDAHTVAYQDELTQEHAQRLLQAMDRLRKGVAEGGLPLHKLLHQCRYSLARNPRDKTYSVLGMSDCVDRAPIPDYALPTEQVYLDFAKFLVHEGRGIDVLSHAGRFRQKLPGLASWVPDWTFDLETSIFQAGNERYWQVPFTASGDSEACISVDEVDSTAVHVEGAVVDRIKAIGPQINSAGWAPWRREFLQWDLASCQILEENAGIHGLTPHEVIQVYTRTLVANGTAYCRGYANVIGQYRRIMEALQQHDWRQRFMRTENLTFVRSLESRSLTAFSERVSGQNDFGFQMADITNGRAICITEKGHIGLALGCSQPGDEVCLIFGARCPFVIRREEESFSLIGDAYVDGIMYDGAAMDYPEFIPEVTRLR
jgi:hypothetical protein